MNNDNKVETAIAGLNCWASYATDCYNVEQVTMHAQSLQCVKNDIIINIIIFYWPQNSVDWPGSAL